ncbi:hypothetical protein HK101_009250 [Irineochytrium annulatum]|nr:hypothetical protein HK101_009250 [Irineochytrium annulatum]
MRKTARGLFVITDATGHGVGVATVIIAFSCCFDSKLFLLRVTQGVALAQSGETEKAMKKYTTAIDIDNSCVDAYVARGAV